VSTEATSYRASVAVSGLVLLVMAAQFLPFPDAKNLNNPLPEKQAMTQVRQTDLGMEQQPSSSAPVAVIYLPPPPEPSSPVKASSTNLAKAVSPTIANEPKKTRLLKPLRPQRPKTPSMVAPIQPLRAQKKPEVQQQPKVREQSPLQATVVEVTVSERRQSSKKGRVLLRLMEHGSGPGVEISWPKAAAGRDTLYNILKECFGMRTILLAPDGRLYASEGLAGRPWTPDTDQFSGFIRQLSGTLPNIERRVVSNLRRRHGITGSVVRVFPRQVDAALLGGFNALLGGNYHSYQKIHGSYVINNDGVSIHKITADGDAVPGLISLSPVNGRLCR